MPTPHAVRLGVFAVEDTSIQVAWGRLGPGRVQLSVGDDTVEVHGDGGPGVLSFTGLAPDTAGEVELRGPGVPDGHRILGFRTLAALPGPELYRFATVSDLHIGSRAFGLLHTMREKPQPDEIYSYRTTRAAFTEAKAWGAERMIAKGDITHHGELDQWAMFGAILEEAGLPTEAIPGNHDVEPVRDLDPNDAFEKLGLETIRDGWRTIDVPGIRIVLIDSTRLDTRRGHLSHLHDVVRDAVGSADGPVWIGMHHHLEQLRYSYFYPPGISGRQATTFLDEVAAANPSSFVSSGHTHRSRRRDHGPVVVTEVGSPEDYPGLWAGYVVHEGGIRQVLRRIEDPRCVPWLEYSGRAFGTIWGRWSPGPLSQRCFNHVWG